MSREHLVPEILVDLLDGTPVEAEHRLHLEGCEDCRRELQELRETLVLLRSDDLEAAPPAPSGSRVGRGRLAALVAVAAALVAAVLALHRPELPSPVNGEEHFLPPVEEDADYQILLSLTREIADEELLDRESGLLSGTLALDPAELTPDERRELLDRLAQDMRSSS